MKGTWSAGRGWRRSDHTCHYAKGSHWGIHRSPQNKPERLLQSVQTGLIIEASFSFIPSSPERRCRSPRGKRGWKVDFLVADSTWLFSFWLLSICQILFLETTQMPDFTFWNYRSMLRIRFSNFIIWRNFKEWVPVTRFNCVVRVALGE